LELKDDTVGKSETTNQRRQSMKYDGIVRSSKSYHQTDKAKADALRVENAKKLRESWRDSDQIVLNILKPMKTCKS
jgi:hypothetical protein